MTIPRHKALEPLVKTSQVAVKSFTSFHLSSVFAWGPSSHLFRSSMYIFVSGLGGHWDAEHCQGAAEGADKDCGSVSVHKILTLCIYVPFQFFFISSGIQIDEDISNLLQFCVHFLL